MAFLLTRYDLYVSAENLPENVTNEISGPIRSTGERG